MASSVIIPIKDVCESTRVLIGVAQNAAKFAHPHISNYHVGCAIRSTLGGIYEGSNIEFDNFSNTIHAEESALIKVVESGGLVSEIAVYTIDDPPFFPCGMCRQSLYEKSESIKTLVIACNDVNCQVATIGELLPYGFSLQ